MAGTHLIDWIHSPLEVFANSPQYKNADIANFVLAVPLEMNKNNEVYNMFKVILLDPLISKVTVTSII